MSEPAYIPMVRRSPGSPQGLVIQGDNLIVLRELRASYAGRVKCIYLDPPYNNGESYQHYKDAAPHHEWERFLAERLSLLRPLLSEDGSIWISIDDTGVHYLKVLCDRVFGRESFVHTIVWEHRRSRENRRAFSNNHEYLLVYAKNPRRFTAARNRIDAADRLRPRYKNPDGDARGPWQSVSANAQAGHGTDSQYYEVVSPSGKRHLPPPGRCWVFTRNRMLELIQDGRIWFGRDGNGVPRVKRYLAESQLEVTPPTLWSADFAGTTLEAKKHLLATLPESPVFETPKPEALLRRIIEISTSPGEIVLDPFLGSGTTSTAAHKLARLHVGIELGDHAVTHAAARLERVVEGEQGGISKAVGWSGGGSFAVSRMNRASEGVIAA